MQRVSNRPTHKVTILDQEDDSFHTDGSTDIHLGFARDEIQEKVEDTGFTQIRFPTAYTIHKNGNTDPLFLPTVRKG